MCFNERILPESWVLTDAQTDVKHTYTDTFKLLSPVEPDLALVSLYLRKELLTAHLIQFHFPKNGRTM